MQCKQSGLAILLLMVSVNYLWAQKGISKKDFFAQQEKVIDATLSTNFSTLINQKKEPVYQPATIQWSNTDSLGDVKEAIAIKLRGNFRKDQCSFASMMFNFSDSTGKSKLKSLKTLKVVVPCEWGSDDEQWVIKEYLVYRMYQLFTPMSFKLRLFRFTFNDINNEMKPYKQYGFAIEDVDDLAKRNEAKEIDETKKIGSEATDRMHTTLVSIFQYMVGNSDWAIPPRHNIKMIAPRKDLNKPPYVVPYDFDYCGAVNALYADPAPHLGIEKVTDRLYFGFPRTKNEIQEILKVFMEKEQEIYGIIQDEPLLKTRGKEEMLNYIKGFYTLIRDNAFVEKVFVAGAKKL